MIHDNLPAAIENLSARCSPSGTLFDFPTKLARRKELEAKMGETSFWDNQESARRRRRTQSAQGDDRPDRVSAARHRRCQSALRARGRGRRPGVNGRGRSACSRIWRRRAKKVELQTLLDGKERSPQRFLHHQSGAAAPRPRIGPKCSCGCISISSRTAAGTFRRSDRQWASRPASKASPCT